MKKYVSIAIGVLIAGGIAYYFYQNTPSAVPTDDAMMEDDGMMNSEDSMMEDDGTATGDAMMKDDGMMNSEDAMMKQTGPAYANYSEGVIGNGQMSILFFHAAWCPTCKQADADLTDIYKTGGTTISTYKVDYDTQTELKERYGITNQHTFVVINGEGESIKVITGPTVEQLKSLVL